MTSHPVNIPEMLKGCCEMREVFDELGDNLEFSYTFDDTAAKETAVMLGAYDDLRGANAVVKFAGLGLIATLFYALGGRIDALSIPLVGSVQLPPLVSFALTIV